MTSIAATVRRRRRVSWARLGSVCVLALGVAGADAVPAGAAPAGAAVPAGRTGSLNGDVIAPSPSGATVTVPVAGIAVAATGPTGVTYATTTAANGFYELDQLPAPASYSVTFGTSAGGQPQTQPAVAVPAGAVATADDVLSGAVATITGLVTDSSGRALPGMEVGLGSSPSTACPLGAICGPTTTSDADGHYTLNVAPGGYELETLDSGRVVDDQTVDAAAGDVSTVDVLLPAAPVPAGTTATHAARDLSWLNGERAQAGLPAGVTLNPRWSLECAAHDAYERDNNVLSHAENPQAPGASVGGAWAGLTSVLAQSRWVSGGDPWQNAPIHLMQLFSPSLSVIGIDDSGGRQCATTYPGLLRTPATVDAVSTYPGDGARDVPPSEIAREAAFVPGQFVGLPAGRATGRELFVYLNDANQTGQAPVEILHATLSQGQHAAAVRWVDNSTPTVGRYLTGAILIPLAPLRGRTTYTASVVVQNRSGSITHSWTFTTAPS